MKKVSVSGVFGTGGIGISVGQSFSINSIKTMHGYYTLY